MKYPDGSQPNDRIIQRLSYTDWTRNTQHPLELWGVVVQQPQFVELFVDDVHDVLWDRPLFEPLSELLLDGFFVLLLQTQLLLTHTQIKHMKLPVWGTQRRTDGRSSLPSWWSWAAPAAGTSCGSVWSCPPPVSRAGAHIKEWGGCSKAVYEASMFSDEPLPLGPAAAAVCSARTPSSAETEPCTDAWGSAETHSSFHSMYTWHIKKVFY